MNVLEMRPNCRDLARNKRGQLYVSSATKQRLDEIFKGGYADRLRYWEFCEAIVSAGLDQLQKSGGDAA